MKRFLALLCSFFCAGALAACSFPLASDKPASMNIQPTRLTQEEKQIVELVDGSSNCHIFDFQADKSLQSIRINTYQLEDGQWQPFSGGGSYAFEEKGGRLSLTTEKIPLGMRCALQGSSGFSSSKYASDLSEEAFEEMGIAIAYLSNPAEIRYEEEIPLAVQIFTTQDTIHSYDVSFFHTPEEYAKYGYEYVYAVTVLFSQKPLS